MLSSGDIDELHPTQGNFPRKNVPPVRSTGDSFARAQLPVVHRFHHLNSTKQALCDDVASMAKPKLFYAA
jgi:hypothetical protein